MSFHEFFNKLLLRNIFLSRLLLYSYVDVTSGILKRL